MKIAARCVAGEECGMWQGKPGGVIKGGTKWGLAPSNIWNIENKCVFKKCTRCSSRCPGTFVLVLMAQMKGSLFLSSAQGATRVVGGHHVSSKSPSRVRDEDEGVAGRNFRE